MAQFPDVKMAVSAVQEILNTPYGPHIRSYPSTPRIQFYLTLFLECVELLDDHSLSLYHYVNDCSSDMYDP